MLQQSKSPEPQVISDARRLAAVGADREMILVFLRDRGFDKIDSIKTVRALYGLSMPEAKDLLDYSAAWSDRFESDIEFRETALRVLRDLAAESADHPDLPKITFTEPEDIP
jgi:hypothetical protein